MQKEEKVIVYYQECRGWKEVRMENKCEQEREPRAAIIKEIKSAALEISVQTQ